MKVIHEFKEKLAVGKEGEKILDTFFKTVLGVEESIPATLNQEFSIGYDRKLIKNGKSCLIEYKTDDKGIETGNVFIEVISNNNTRRKGWILTSKADWIAILVNPMIYLMSMPELQAYMKENGPKYPYKTSQNKTYYSEGYCMPITDLKLITSLKTYNIDKDSK